MAHEVSLLTQRAYTQRKIASPCTSPSQKLAPALLGNMPFQMTGAQQRVSQEIMQDLQRNKPMLRLVQGDVGAGKTLVAAVAAFMP